MMPNKTLCTLWSLPSLLLPIGDIFPSKYTLPLPFSVFKEYKNLYIKSEIMVSLDFRNQVGYEINKLRNTNRFFLGFIADR